MERFAVAEAEAVWDVTLTGTVGGGESLSPSRSTLAGADVVDTDSAFFELGVTKPFRMGPSLGFNWRSDRTFTNSTFSTINPAYDSSLEISLTVPLLQGAGRQANESDLRAARAGGEAARLDLLAEADTLVQSIGAAYWQLVYLQDRVGLLEKSVQVAREIEASERRKLEPDIGRSTRLDVTKAVAETKRREAAVIRGRFEAEGASDALRRLVLPFTGAADDRVVLRAVGVPSDATPVPDLEALLATALERRPELRRTEADLVRLHEAVVRARDNLRVRLDLSANVRWRGVSSDFGRGAGDVLAGETPSADAAISLVWPLGRRAARAALRRAELELERAKVDRQEQINGIVAEVREARRALRTAVREIEAATEEVKAAAEALDGERRRLERGTATILDVSRLEENLTEAELRLLQARTDRERAVIDIQRVAGTLSERIGLTLDDGLNPTRRSP